MPTRIIDLDAVAAEDMRVKLGGNEYKLPSDLPIPQYLRIQQLWVDATDPEAEGTFTDLYDEVVDVFAEHNELPIGADDKPELPLGPRQLGALIVQIYSGELDEGEDEETDRPPKPRGGTRNTTSKRKGATRSRSRK